MDWIGAPVTLVQPTAITLDAIWQDYGVLTTLCVATAKVRRISTARANLLLLVEYAEHVHSRFRKRFCSELQQQRDGAVANDTGALVVVIFDLLRNDGAGDAERRLPILVHGFQVRALRNKKLNHLIHCFVG